MSPSDPSNQGDRSSCHSTAPPLLFPLSQSGTMARRCVQEEFSGCSGRTWGNHIAYQKKLIDAGGSLLSQLSFNSRAVETTVSAHLEWR